MQTKIIALIIITIFMVGCNGQARIEEQKKECTSKQMIVDDEINGKIICKESQSQTTTINDNV